MTDFVQAQSAAETLLRTLEKLEKDPNVRADDRAALFDRVRSDCETLVDEALAILRAQGAEDPDKLADEASRLSFPASDAPAY